MFYPIIPQEELFLDNEMRPLINGKLEILDPISNNLINVYTYSDNDYTLSTNPVRLDVEGRTEHTIFSDRLSFIRVYAYKGIDENNHEIFEFIREYFAGLEALSEVRECVATIEELKDVDPTINPYVNVYGYYDLGDCQMRTYVFDENSTLDADNGYVIASDVSDTGRWILQYDGAYIPSSFYGVWPGQVSNLNALCSFIGEIKGKKTAMGIYFIPGNYGNVTASTTKKVLISSETQMDEIQCYWIDVKGKPTAAIADIVVYDTTCPVSSSWFKSAKKFWSCPSRIKHCDGYNWTDDKLTADVTSNYTTFITDGEHTLDTDTDAYKINLVGCEVVGEFGFIDKTIHVRYANMEFSDKYYAGNDINPSKIDFGNNVIVDADNFVDGRNLAKVAYKANINDLDFKGHYIDSSAYSPCDCTQYEIVRNLNANYAIIGKANTQTKVYDSKINYCTIDNVSVEFYNTEATLVSLPANFNTLNVYNNSIISGNFAITRGNINCWDSEWYSPINEASDNTSNDYAIKFFNSKVTATINTKNVEFVDCKIINSNITIYPYYENSKYKLHLVIEHCDVNNINPIAFDQYGVWFDGQCWWSDVRICNSVFKGNELGITCPYYRNNAVPVTFIIQDYSNTDYLILNNTGKVPAGGDFKARLCSEDSFAFTTTQAQGIENNPIALYVQGNVSRIWTTYEPYHGLAATYLHPNRSMQVYGTFTYPLGDSAHQNDPSAYLPIYHNEQYPIMVYPEFINNCPFSLFNTDESFTGERNLTATNDYFANRLVRVGVKGTTVNLAYIFG